jgi:ribonuclease D
LAQKLASNRRMDRTEYAVLRELVRWREHSVRSRDLPRKWLAEDQLLVKLATAQPTRVEDLAHFRGLGAKLIEHGAKGLLGAIQRGLDTPVSEVPKPPERNDAAQDEQPALSVLRCFTTMLAREHDVAVRFVVDPDALLALLRGRFETVDDLRAANILGRGAVEMFGEEMIEILNGRRALRLESGHLHRYTPNGRGSSLT